MEFDRKILPAGQIGKSAIGSLIVLAMIAFGIWVGIQYIPQRIEAGTVRTILDQVQQRHNATPIQDDRDLWAIIGNHLHLNGMDDMRNHFKARWDQDRVTVTVDYERDLNLVFTSRIIEYHEELVLH
jgi:hypothetical protein